MRFRGKTIRRKIVALLIVPLLSVMVLSALAALLTGSETFDLRGLQMTFDRLGTPVQLTLNAVQRERLDTLVYLADPSVRRSAEQLDAARQDTDEAIARVKAGDTAGNRGRLEPSARDQLATFLGQLGGLEKMRSDVDKKAVQRGTALDFYDNIVDPGGIFLADVYGAQDVDQDNQGRALAGLGQATEMFAREDAVITSALITGSLSTDDRRRVAALAADRALLYRVNFWNLPAQDTRTVKGMWATPAAARVTRVEDSIMATGEAKAPEPLTAQGWRGISGPVLGGLGKANADAGALFQKHIAPLRHGIYVRFALATGVGLIALLASILVSVRVGRGLIRDLSELRKEAHEASGVRLPSVMRRLAAGEQVDVATEVPRLDYEKDEIGQVGQALNTLQRAAVEAAVKQADLRRGVSEVFVNLARRSQVLLHRQLTLLDTMERRTEDTEELADLFRLDHLTTRMRRHAEGLVILSGAAPSRQWRRPVQLMDVVRAAVAEVEDYERIEVRRLPRIGVGGPAVADLTHLIAELLENATVFSPPHTAVQVNGERVSNGFTLEIHDRGLGMAPDLLLDANLRLAETPEFELSDTDRLGLFVVSRLAQRQNVRVSLRQSPYGGTTAVVFLPVALLTDAPETEPDLRIDTRSDREAVTAGSAGRLASLSRLAARGETSHDAHGAGGTAAGDDGDDAPAEYDEDRPAAHSGPRTGIRYRLHEAGPAEGDASTDAAPGPLPRRNAPTLIADRGRRLDERPDRSRPGQPGPAAQGAPSGGGKEAPGVGGLPRRVRQASLAPQLRDTSAGERPARDRPVSYEDAEREAEAVRDRMASLQRGWQRGRLQNDAEDSPRSGATPRTTSEGDGR